MTVPFWPPRISPLDHSTVPLFVKVQLGMSRYPAPSAVSVASPERVNVPPRRPPVQPISPLNTALVLPTNSPPSTVKEPLGLTVNGPLSASVRPASESVTTPALPLPRMIPPTVVAPSRVTVTSSLVMMAVSCAPGTPGPPDELQLAGLLQSPLLGLTQVKVAARLERTPAMSNVKSNSRPTETVFLRIDILAKIRRTMVLCLPEGTAIS